MARRLQGRNDSPLTATGRCQARAHLAWLGTLAPDRMLASPLGRVRATVAILAPALGLTAHWDDRLSERCMGRFEGMTLEEIAAAAPEHFRMKREDPWHWRPPGGENYDDMLARTAPLVRALCSQPRPGRTLVVSHGTIVRPILAQLLGLSRTETLAVRAPNDLAYRVCLQDARGAPATAGPGAGAAARGTASVRHWRHGEWRDGLLLEESA